MPNNYNDSSEFSWKNLWQKLSTVESKHLDKHSKITKEISTNFADIDEWKLVYQHISSVDWGLINATSLSVKSENSK